MNAINALLVMILVIAAALAVTLYELGAHWGCYVGLAALTYHATRDD
jgi:hypothetical protein